MNLCRSMTGAMRKYWTGMKLAMLCTQNVISFRFLLFYVQNYLLNKLST
jgi:hypothetical protein